MYEKSVSLRVVLNGALALGLAWAGMRVFACREILGRECAICQCRAGQPECERRAWVIAAGRIPGVYRSGTLLKENSLVAACPVSNNRNVMKYSCS